MPNTPTALSPSMLEALAAAAQGRLRRFEAPEYKPTWIRARKRVVKSTMDALLRRGLIRLGALLSDDERAWEITGKGRAELGEDAVADYSMEDHAAAEVEVARLQAEVEQLRAELAADPSNRVRAIHGHRCRLQTAVDRLTAERDAYAQRENAADTELAAARSEIGRIAAERDRYRNGWLLRGQQINEAGAAAVAERDRAVAAELRRQADALTDRLPYYREKNPQLHDRAADGIGRAAVALRQRAAELVPEPVDPVVIAQVREAIAAGRFGCVLTTDDQPEYWPDCTACSGSGGIGLCPECEVGPAEQCEACGGMGKVRPTAERGDESDPACACPSNEACVPCGLPTVEEVRR